MKILHIYNDYFPPVVGGIEKHINAICTGLRERFQFQVLVANRYGKTELENINDIDIVRAAEFGRFQSAPICPTMPLWLKKSDADILHFHLPCPSAMISYFSTRPKAKVIATYHSDIVRQRWAIGIYGPLLKKFLKRTDCIIATSPLYITSSPFLRELKDKCVVIPHGVDITKYKPCDAGAVRQLPLRGGNEITGEAISDDSSRLLRPESTGAFGTRNDREGCRTAPAENGFILFVGKLRYYKGLPYLIKAMKNIESRLLIIGTGSEERKLKKLVNKLNLRDKITFLGEVLEEKLAYYYENCSIFVLPSIYRTEAFGIVQLEAMACGKPVISTALDTGVPWVNRNGITGFVVPPKDTASLENAINRLLGNKILREEMGRNGRLRVENEFSTEMMLKRIAEIYMKVFNGETHGL